MFLHMQYDLQRMNVLKEILLELREGASTDSIQTEFTTHFNDVSKVELILMELELLSSDNEVTVEDVKRLSHVVKPLSFETRPLPKHHPVSIFKEENRSILNVLSEMDHLLSTFDTEVSNLKASDKLKQYTMQLGSFHGHFNRKEKIMFPILERYGNYARFTRIVWGIDDRIRGHYKALKAQVLRLPAAQLPFLRKTFDKLRKGLDEMIFMEKEMVLPILQTEFNEKDWFAVANESDAFGYTLIEPPEEIWKPVSNETIKETNDNHPDNIVLGGGGYLTTEEAQHILNNIPLEITFVDKTALFKYYNETTEDPSEMMLVRTPSSIGRNVANCHPPKSLRKMATLIRDLRTGRRKSESMWFKKKDQYIYITYKPVLNDEGEFLGILEYVQDIKPFFELSSEVKMGLSKIEE